MSDEYNNNPGKHPFDPKTGKLVFTPVLRSTGERLDLEVDYFSFPKSKSLGFHGITQDLKSGKRYAVFGKECDIPGCNCDAWVEEVDAIRKAQTLSDWCNIYDGLSEEEIEEIEKVILQRANLTRFVRPLLISLVQTCEYAPAQWEGRTSDDRPVYIRGRHRILSAHIGLRHGSISDAVSGKELSRISHEDADTLSFDEIKNLLADVLDFSRIKQIDASAS